jgi:aminoglycoside phosphotransferase (APT) family kinase protein
MRPLAHAYTNTVHGDGRLVVKRYQGPDRVSRRARELSALTQLRGLLPVPAVLPAATGDALSMEFVAGVHGQELIEAGYAREVMRACGEVLRRIHAVDVTQLFPNTAGPVIVHGDFGPNNVLLSPEAHTIVAVLDWEWTHPGEPVEDLAWGEWIVRMHHPRDVDALDDFFEAYGHRPGWPERHRAMQDQCRRLIEVCRRWSDDAVMLWQRRLATTAAWTE